MLKNIRVILVDTSHPGNIGAAARAMKTMGLTQLVLVSPRTFPHPKAIEMSSHADDILDNARVVSSLQEALKDCCLAIGTSARVRTISLRLLEPRACAEKIIQTIAHSDNNAALVFGREDSGLTNEELLNCHYHVNIPSNPEYSSLNLAAAVQVLCYEMRIAVLKECSEKPDFSKKDPLATINEVEQFYEHLEALLADLHFLKKENPTLMPKVRRIFNRIHLEKPEINILRGMLTAVQKKFAKKNIC